MTVIRSRRAGMSPEEARARPVYARVLGLQYLRPSSLMCFLFFEGSIALGTLLALAELVDWWVVAVLPASVAAMVKINDVIAGAVAYAASAAVPKARGRAKVPRAGSPRGAGVPQRAGALRNAAPQDARGLRGAAAQQDARGSAPSQEARGARGSAMPPDAREPRSVDVPQDAREQRGYGTPQDAERQPGAGHSWEAAEDLQQATPISPGDPEWVGSPEQRARQSAARRYE